MRDALDVLLAVLLIAAAGMAVGMATYAVLGWLDRRGGR